MAMFVHLTRDSQLARIRRNGISRMWRPSGDFPGGVFAVPVTSNFYFSHQWLRELKRWKRSPLSGVYFRIPDAQPVWAGHYHQEHCWMRASEAVKEFSESEDAQGWEVIIPRRIDSSEIHRVRSLPQGLGWRFSPTSKGRPPYCTCKYCTRGEYGARKLRQRLGSPDE